MMNIKLLLSMRESLLKRFFLFAVTFFLSCYSLSCSNEYSEKRSSDVKPYMEEVRGVTGRGLVALPKDFNRIFLSWRLLPNDQKGVSFNVYRKEMVGEGKSLKLLYQTDQTSYIDSTTEENRKYLYIVKPVFNQKEGTGSKEVIVNTVRKGQNALVFDTGRKYKQVRVVPGDLDGDGELDFIIVHSNDVNIDPWDKAWKKSDDTIKVSAFLHSGKHLWTMDLGWGIEAGSNYSPVVVWDLDADGRSEVLLKKNSSGDPRNYAEERLTMLNGETGKIVKEAKWPPVDGLGDDYNSNSRNYIAVAHLDGKNPFIIVARGLYSVQRIWAYDKNLTLAWERMVGLDILKRGKILWGLDIKLKEKWNQVRRLWGRLTGGPIPHWTDQSRGSHNIPISDVNDDGKEELLWGEHCIGENGKDLWVIERPYRGHPDVVFAADILPSNKGKEIYYAREAWGGKDENVGVLLADSRGKTLWAKWGYTHIDGGWAAKILSDQEGMQIYAYDVSNKNFRSGEEVKYDEITHFLLNSDGKHLGNPDLYGSIPIDWDGDGIKEIYTQNNDEVKKFNGPTLAKLQSGCLFAADLLGDHREEMVIAPGDGKIYILFNTEKMEAPPMITRLADRQYKNDLSRTAVGSRISIVEGGFVPRMH